MIQNKTIKKVIIRSALVMALITMMSSNALAWNHNIAACLEATVAHIQKQEQVFAMPTLNACDRAKQARQAAIILFEKENICSEDGADRLGVDLAESVVQLACR